MKKYRNVIWLYWLIIVLSACAIQEESPGNVVADTLTPLPPTITQIPTEAPQPSLTPTPAPTAAPSATPIMVFPPEPIEIPFEAADGKALSGLYYPADSNPAPIIVLMPWSRGNQSEWEEVATWLQGRGLLVREPDYRHSWKSSNWFPKRTLKMPLGVFTFNFRSCEGEDGCQAYLPAEWLLDAQAALETASRLEGVDPGKVIAVGASIGADGAAYSCAWLNTTDLGKCLGTFALSPSSSLTIDFSSAVDSLLDQENPALVYCLYGLRDEAAQETCQDYPGIRTIHFGYVDYHGLELILFDRSPNTLDYLQEFISEALGGGQ